MLVEVLEKRPREVEAREPQPHAGVRRQDLGRPAGGQDEPLAGVDAAEGIVARAQLHDPELLGILALGRRREPELERGSIGPGRRKGRSERRRRVDDDEVAGREEPWEVGEVAVDNRVAGTVGDEQTDVVAGEPSRLGRLVRLEGTRKLEGRRAHADAPTRSRAR